MKQIFLSTARLGLKQMDMPFLKACLNGSFEVAETHIGLKLPQAWRDDLWLAEFRYKQAREDESRIAWLPLALYERESNTMVGHLNFHTPPNPEYLQAYASNAIEFGYEVFPEYRQRGYGFEAVEGVIAWLAQHEEIEHIVLSITAENTPSQRIAHKLGFKKCGEVFDEDDGVTEEILVRAI
jgi:ribosomal-protein-alanine N-acetyltransferase